MKTAPLFTENAKFPPGGRGFILEAEDGVRLRVGLWKPENVRNGTVFLFPGITAFIEGYGLTISSLYRQGYVPFVIDWRGQGYSDRPLGDSKKIHIDDFSHYQRDVRAMVNAAVELDLPKPWHVLSVSMGGALALRAIINGLPVQSCAFASPMWGIRMAPPLRPVAWSLSWASQVLGIADIFYVPGQNGETEVLKTRFEDNENTSDPAIYQYWIKQAKALPDLHTGGPTMGWLLHSLRECRNLATQRSPDIPCIVFCGERDQVIEIPAIQNRMKSWPGGELVMVSDAKHDVLSETLDIRQRVMSGICNFFVSKT